MLQLWSIFSEFLIYCRPISQTFRRMKQQQNMRSEGNIGHIVRGKQAITSSSLTYKISTFF